MSTSGKGRLSRSAAEKSCQDDFHAVLVSSFQPRKEDRESGSTNDAAKTWHPARAGNAGEHSLLNVSGGECVEKPGSPLEKANEFGQQIQPINNAYAAGVLFPLDVGNTELSADSRKDLVSSELVTDGRLHRLVTLRLPCKFSQARTEKQKTTSRRARPLPEARKVDFEAARRRSTHVLSYKSSGWIECCNHQ